MSKTSEILFLGIFISIAIGLFSGPWFFFGGLAITYYYYRKATKPRLPPPPSRESVNSGP